MIPTPLLIFILCLFGWVSSLARADILFIGLNPADGEIQTAQKVAEKTGDGFFYWPQITKAQLKPIDDLDVEEAQLIKDFEKELTEEQEVAIQDRMVQIQEERQALREQLGVNVTTLKNFLATLESQNVKLTTIIISGHDGNGKFWGRFADNLDTNAFAQGFAMAPKATSEIKTVALLGCYTTSVGALDTYWKKIFPNAKVFGGYDEKGPNADVVAGHKYLEAFLLKAEQIEAAQSKEEFWKIFRNLPHVRNLAASVVSNQFFANNKGPASLEEMYAACKELRVDSKLRKSFTCYYQAEEGCENVPKDTSRGEVRLFYEELHEKAHCRAFLTVEEDHSLPKTELVLNLIFFENMKGNYFRLYRTQLIELDEWLMALGIAPLKLNETARSRSQLLKDIRQAYVAVDTFGAAVMPNQASKEYFLKKFNALNRLTELDNTLLQLKPHCAPSEWVDPMQSKTSACVQNPEALESKSQKQWARWRNKGR